MEKILEASKQERKQVEKLLKLMRREQGRARTDRFFCLEGALMGMANAVEDGLACWNDVEEPERVYGAMQALRRYVHNSCLKLRHEATWAKKESLGGLHCSGVLERIRLEAR